MTIVAEPDLTDDERAILRVGCAFYDNDGAVLNEIRALGMTEGGFFHRLRALLDTERALAADPVNVNRLRRLVAARTARRGRG